MAPPEKPPTIGRTSVPSTELPNLPRRLALAQLPTRILHLPLLSAQLPVDLYMKRDDETGVELSGNKVRKLEFLLAEALEHKADHILTCGGVQSNHGRATAVAARRLGMDCTLFLRTPDGRPPRAMDGNLLLDRMVGARLRFISPETYAHRSAVLDEEARHLRSGGRRPYIIPEGGSNALGSCGYIATIFELVEQMTQGEPPALVPWRDRLPRAVTAADRFVFDHVVFATGSGGTAAGLHLGRHLAGLAMDVWGVPVCDDRAYFMGRVEAILDEYATRFGDQALRDARGVSARETLDRLHFIDGYKGPAYAVPYPQELELVRELAAHEGVLLDPVYTGKAFYGMVTEAERGRFSGPATASPNQHARKPRVLFLHTGGVFSLYAYRDELLG